MAKGAILEQSLPQYLVVWVDKSSDLCIFEASHMETWPLRILQSCPWFLECALTFCTAEEEQERNSIGDDVSLPNLTPPEVVHSVVPEVRGNRKRGLKVSDTSSQENMVLRSSGTKTPMVSRACASEDHIDLSQYDNCVQMTGISTLEVSPRTSAQIILENTSVLKVVTGESPDVLLKTNEFVKQVSILPTFKFFHIANLKKIVSLIISDIDNFLLFATI